MVISRIDELFFRSAQSGIDLEATRISPDDYKECNYLLRTTSNLVSTLSHGGWATLLTHPLTQADKHQDVASEGEIVPYNFLPASDIGDRSTRSQKPALCGF